MMTLVWHWPQITWAILAGLSLLVAAMLDGEEKTGNHSFALSLCATAIGFFIMWQGGFFTGASP